MSSELPDLIGVRWYDCPGHDILGVAIFSLATERPILIVGVYREDVVPPHIFGVPFVDIDHLKFTTIMPEFAWPNRTSEQVIARLQEAAGWDRVVELLKCPAFQLAKRLRMPESQPLLSEADEEEHDEALAE